jgi:hypothetical protein
LLPRLTATPPVGAALESVTVPVAGLPPTTLVGFTVSPVSAGRVGDTVRSAERVTPPPVTEIVTVVGAETGAVAMSKLPLSVEALIVMISGTEATPGLLLVTRMRWSKPAIDAAGIVTIPREPLVVETGLSVRKPAAAPVTA